MREGHGVDVERALTPQIVPLLHRSLPNFLSRRLAGENFKWYWTEGEIYFVYEPISLTFKALVRKFLGSSAPVNYDVNIFLHSINVLLSKVLTVQVFKSIFINNKAWWEENGGDVDIFVNVGVFLFSVHPLRAEAVGWLSCQPYLLATAFAMGSLLLYLKKWVRCSQVLYTMSVLSKTIMVPLPAVLVLFDVFGKRRKKNRPLTFGVIIGRSFRSVWKNLLYFSIGTLVGVKTVRANSFGSSTSNLTAFQGGLKFLHTIFFYFSKTTLPTRISGFYPLVEEDYRSFNWEVFIGCTFSLCVLVVLMLMLFAFAGKCGAAAGVSEGFLSGALIKPNPAPLCRSGCVRGASQRGTHKTKHCAPLPERVCRRGFSAGHS